MKSRTVYVLLAIAFGVSVALTMVSRLGDIARAVFAVPAAVAMIGAIVQLLRDQVAHDRTLAIQATQNSFAIGATSHMASVAFDKHVEFSEEYVAEMFNTLKTLFREGPTDQALPHAARLYEIRQKWALWLTPAIEANLDKFEAAIRKIGADAHFVCSRSRTSRPLADDSRDVCAVQRGHGQRLFGATTKCRSCDRECRSGAASSARDRRTDWPSSNICLTIAEECATGNIGNKVTGNMGDTLPVTGEERPSR
jgi:hypothetical protein